MSLHTQQPIPHENYFSTLTSPTAIKELIPKLKKLPIPNPATVHSLQTYSRTAWKNGNKSVVYAHLPTEPTLFPLWVISWWSVLLTHLQKVDKPWRKNLAWIHNARTTQSNHDLHEDAHLVFLELGSVSFKAPKEGFTDHRPIHTLWRLLGNNWMDSTVIDSMLEVLKHTIMSEDPTSKFIVQQTDLLAKLVDVFGQAEASEEQYERHRWLQVIGQDVFQNGKTLATIVHLGKLPALKEETEGMDHWVPLVINGEKSVFLYGDSLCGQKDPVMPPKLRHVLTSWRHMHTSTEFSTAVLPTTQQNDNFSCGPFAFNTVEAYIRPFDIELLRPAQAARLRLQMQLMW
ncbi:hypothetical protein K435DRAFT_808634 [Dendrothele bispora CBS 962.96]|uniref:Ubiquitin-like protease family profile domain-containing protein n=1 Tax=Dendrothele bispora (strain CBS 962.96) TaxID=1314807 RepID=A0A4V4HC56_DENBC|nr:hypothetical protein K435DRAFT_808634 [Dendrothele bispora CBS 962.96]